mmetsp:Transcript_32893/g.43359  ORF Transcript_32893/g.43359 Transcript_32893/m.43359 type:complete len:87 (-) Transcript_32893:96-356(-)
MITLIELIEIGAENEKATWPLSELLLQKKISDRFMALSSDSGSEFEAQKVTKMVEMIKNEVENQLRSKRDELISSLREIALEKAKK